MADSKRLKPQADVSKLPSMLSTLNSYADHFGPDNLQTLSVLTRIGIAYSQLGALDQAQQLLEQAVAAARSALGLDHEVCRNAVVGLVDIYVAQGKVEQAVNAQHELVNNLERLHGPGHPDAVAARFDLAKLTCALAGTADGLVH